MLGLIIGDPHFKVNNTVDTDEMTIQIINVVREKMPDFVVILGDVLDRHENIHMTPLIKSVSLLRQIQDLVPLYVIIGNHDRKNNKVYLTEEHPFTALKYWNNTIIIDTVQNIQIKNIQFTFVPYVAPGLFKEALNTVKNWQESVCIFCHQEFKSAQMGAFTSVDGDEWETDYPYIISGHIHDYQKLQNNILYLGTPIQHSFGDSTNKKIALITFENQIKNHQDLVIEKIKLKIKLKKNIHLTPDEVDDYELDDTINAKIIITGTLIETKQLMKNTTIEKWRKQGIKVVFKNKASNIPLVQHIANESFTSLLYNNVKNTNLLSIYTELFGNHNII